MATVTVDEDRSSTDHALYDRKAIKQFNSNNTHESGADREAMQCYHDRVHQQQKQSLAAWSKNRRMYHMLTHQESILTGRLRLIEKYDHTIF